MSLHCFVSLLIFSTSTAGLAVVLGLQSQEGSNPNAVSRTVSQIINHPSYNPSTFDNDISLLKLSSPVTFNDFIVPVCLAASDSTFNDGVDTWITGWGNIGSGGRSLRNWGTSITCALSDSKMHLSERRKPFVTYSLYLYFQHNLHVTILSRPTLQKY